MAERNEATEKLKYQIKDALQTAKTLRDGIRVELHLASLDAQEKWKELEPRLGDAERFGDEISETARAAASRVASSFQEFKSALKRHSAAPVR